MDHRQTIRGGADGVKRFRRRWIGWLMLAAMIAAAGVGWWRLRTPTPAFSIVRDIEYASVQGQPLRLDLYLPSDRVPPPAVIVWIHGGGWRYGDKSHCPLRFLASEGYAIASIDHRLSPQAPFPAQIHDCKAAVRWLRAHAAEYRLDASRIVAAGESAGAHLALLLATTGGEAALEGAVGDHIGESSAVAAAIDFFGSGDLTAYAEKPVGESNEALSLLLGGPVGQRLELARQASPLFWVSEGDAPALVLHAEADAVVPIEQSRRMVEQYRARRVKVAWHWLAGPQGGHDTGPFLDSAGMERIRVFLREHVGR